MEQAEVVRALADRVAELESLMGRLRRSEWVWPAATERLPAWPVVDTLEPASDLQAYRTLTLRGTPDSTYICLRDVDGTWTWVELATAGFVAAINVLLEGSLVGTRNTINLRAGDHIDLTVTDDDVNGRVNTLIDVDDSGLTTASAFATHASRHENGGADEVSVAGLSGLLADGQTPLAHATSHERGGADELTDLAFTPDVPGDWSPAPDDVAEALDQLAARVTALEP